MDLSEKNKYPSLHWFTIIFPNTWIEIAILIHFMGPPMLGNLHVDRMLNNKLHSQLLCLHNLGEGPGIAGWIVGWCLRWVHVLMRFIVRRYKKYQSLL